jgi:hypothetical protein
MSDHRTEADIVRAELSVVGTTCKQAVAHGMGILQIA